MSLFKSNLITLSAFILTAGILSACVKDVNLANDVDMMIKTSPTPINNLPQESPLTMTTSTPNPATNRPKASSSPLPTNKTDIATVSAVPLSQHFVITTNKGVIKIKLNYDKAPQTVANLTAKVKANFYQNLTFHRVEDWVIQGGDPLGNGTGGGKQPTELSSTPFKIGSVGIARGMDINQSNDSQFFICKTDCSWLTGQYTHFGEVVSGMDVVNQIAKNDRIDKAELTP